MEYNSDKEVVFVVRVGWLSKILIFFAVILAWAMPFLIQQLISQLSI